MTAQIWLIRHGETEWSRTGRHTGRTDVPLTEAGVAAAARLAPRVSTLSPGLVLCSPLQRARDTARLAGLTPDSCTDDLLEWDYGAWEGPHDGRDPPRSRRPRLAHLGSRRATR